jgi:hypothetical protein
VTEDARSRVLDAGFALYALDPSGRSFLAPGGARVLSLEEAVAELDGQTSETESGPALSGCPTSAAALSEAQVDQYLAALRRDPREEFAGLLIERLKPVIRAEVRSALGAKMKARPRG